MHDALVRPQVDFVVAFLGVTYTRAVAAPLNAAYKQVGPEGGTCGWDPD